MELIERLRYRLFFHAGVGEKVDESTYRKFREFLPKEDGMVNNKTKDKIKTKVKYILYN